MRKFVLTTLLSLLSLSPGLARAQYRVVPAIRVGIAPPPIRVETAPPAPSFRHQWISGYWGWRGGAHVWFHGHWGLPPAPGYVWEPARWEVVDGGWEFFEGHWRPAEQPDPVQAYQPPPPPMQETIVETEPPPPIVEVRPALPFEGAIWIPGFWHWNGVRHVWAAGRWSARPAGYHWEEHRWEHRPDGRWAHHPGYWRR